MPEPYMEKGKKLFLQEFHNIYSQNIILQNIINFRK